MTIDKALRYLDSVRDADPLMGEIHDAVRATMRRHNEVTAQLIADVKESGQRMQRELADHEDTKKFFRDRIEVLEAELARVNSRVIVCEKHHDGVRAHVVEDLKA